MSSLESFSDILNEVIAGDKLSSSKVERVREAAERCLNRGAELAAIIQKEHKESSSRTRLNSLYLFDAVSRHAGDVIRKKASGYNYKDAEPPKGSKAAYGTKQALFESALDYMYAASGIVEDLVLSTHQIVKDDYKPKVVKVVDIWMKAGTFDKDLLMRIKGLLNAAQYERRHTDEYHSRSNESGSEKVGRAPSPYSMAMQRNSNDSAGSSHQKSELISTSQVPSSLLALLGAANKNGNGNGQLVENKSFDPASIAKLQQLTQQNNHTQKHKREASNDYVLPLNRPDEDNSQGFFGNSSVQKKKTPPPVDDDVVPSDVNTQGKIETSSFSIDESVGDLSQFNFSLFDPTIALHWIRFAQHWYNSYQYIPSNQECMWAMLSALQSQMIMAATTYEGNNSW